MLRTVVSRKWRWLGLGPFAALAGLALVPSAPAARATAASAATAVCSTSNLRVDKIGEQGFTSHRAWAFALRNIGTGTCRLTGFPDARLLDRQARGISTRVSHFGGPARNVVLRPFGRSYFTLIYTVSGPCPRALFAYGVRIRPPGSSQRLVWYQGRFDVCGPAPAFVRVSPVTATRPF